MAQSDDNMDLWLRALTGELTAEERLRLDRDDPEFAELEEMAAIYDLARSTDAVEPMPEHLAERIRAQAVLPTAEQPAATVTQISPQPAAQPRGQNAGLAWFAAAACLVAAIAGWWPETPAPAPSEPTVAELRDQLAAEDPEVVQFALAGTEDPAAAAAAEGSVVWSQADQRGYMTIRNLAPNNPDEAQYQLWIFDGTREKHPVDGGVFDVNDAGEVVIPIDPKLPVGQPTLFAITVERPGGVVVSDQGRIAMVGKVGA
ncbi:MAG: anti-sigma factor [Pseudomonadota bacterium]|nr:anti-sigma factor [Pseudomonadota bacterium]